MNLYKIIGVLILLIIVGQIFHIGPAVENFANGISDIPVFEEKGTRPHLLDLGIRLAYLITLVAIVQIMFGKRENDGE